VNPALRAMKILHLEDNPQDAELTHALFVEEWPNCEVVVVDNRQDFQAALTARHDIILSDFTMANFNGLEALEMVREKAPDTPFIFLSGTIGEDRALQALRAGASDYLIKDRPGRLVPAMLRALEDAKMQRERREMAEQMMRVQRLESIGLLAAGIAHDFNNVLAPVLMGVSLFREQVTGASDRQVLNMIELSANRGVELVRQILDFAHGVTGDKQVIQPRHVLREIVDMMRHSFPKNLTIDAQIASELWSIRGNPTQLHQVLLNLCVNARDAMPQGGTLTVRAENRQLDATQAKAMLGAAPGKFLCIEVIDTGTGIPPEVLEKIWDPFFTTKEAGRGTGLGLSTVHSIVEEHRGFISLSTEVGRGTTFRLLFPAEVAPELDGSSPATPLPAARGNGELVLIVDSDTANRDRVAALLTENGYRVLTAGSGTEALALLVPRVLEVRAFITASGVPDLDGVTLAKVVGSLNPSIRVLILGTTGSDIEAAGRLPLSVTAMPPPFSAEAMLGTLRNVLRNKAARPVSVL